MLVANLIGPDIAIVIAVIVLLFGGSQLPKLARSLGQARREFESGHQEEASKQDAPQPPDKKDGDPSAGSATT